MRAVLSHGAPLKLKKNRVALAGLLLLLLLLLLMGSLTGSALAGVGTNSAQFLQLYPTARAEAMGGALTALGDDLSSLSINPSTLGRVKNKEAAFSFLALTEGLSAQYGAYAHPLKFGTLSVSFFNMTYPKIPRFDEGGVKGADFGASDLAIQIGYATPNGVTKSRLGQRFNAGGALKYIRSSIDARSAQTVAIDLGGHYVTGIPGLQIGASLLNLGGKMKFVKDGSSLPFQFRLGAGYKIEVGQKRASETVTFEVDGVVPREGRVFASIGAEYSPLSLFTIRVGYNGLSGLRNKVRAGIGIGTPGIKLDYAFAPLGTDVGVGHRIAFQIKFVEKLWFQKKNGNGQ